MKRLYIHPQTSTTACMPQSHVLLLSNGTAKEPQSAPARVNWGKNVQLVDIYFI